MCVTTYNRIYSPVHTIVRAAVSETAATGHCPNLLEQERYATEITITTQTEATSRLVIPQTAGGMLGRAKKREMMWKLHAGNIL
jgi:hypothetical protein